MMRDIEAGNNRSMSKGRILSTFGISIVIGIVVIILLVIVFRWPTHIDTKMTKAAFQIKYYQEALEKYKEDYGRYPRTEEGLILLTEQRDSDGNTYLVRLLNDPWGNPYNYILPGNHNTGHYDLWTYGADNAPGGEYFNKDITNWDIEID